MEKTKKEERKRKNQKSLGGTESARGRERDDVRV